MSTKTDKHLLSWGLSDGEVIQIDSNLNGSAYSETLKFSCCSNTLVEGNGHTILSGDEDCIDIVRGCNYHIKDLTLECSGLQGITIKGSAKDILLENIHFKGKPKNGYVVLGQYCDYDIIKKPKTQGIKFKNCTFENDAPIVLWNAKTVIFEGNSTKTKKVNFLIVKGYYLFRKISDRIKYGKYGRSRSKENIHRRCC